jgi:hypothetical protein
VSLVAVKFLRLLEGDLPPNKKEPLDSEVLREVPRRMDAPWKRMEVSINGGT